MTDFKPITLWNGIYKIVTKTLNNKLKVFLNSFISQSQSAFVYALAFKEEQWD